MGKTFIRLRERLRKDFPDLYISENAIIYRRYTGCYEREAGIWCWFIPSAGVGSTFTATECVKAKTLTYKRRLTGWLSVRGDAEIYADI